jgi:hypothetical protein
MRCIICTVFNAYNWGDEVREVEMGGTCSTYRAGYNVYRILVVNLKGTDLYGRIILNGS